MTKSWVSAQTEKEELLGFLTEQQKAFSAAAHGLTDEQARSRPTVSALSIGELIRHIIFTQQAWVERVLTAPHLQGPAAHRGGRSRTSRRLRTMAANLVPSASPQ